MATRKDMIIAILATFCLTFTLFIAMPSLSQPSTPEYNPWADLNDDGLIDIYDVVMVTGIYDASGTPVNKTALLYDVDATFTDLLSRIGGMNTSLIELQGRIGDLNASDLLLIVDSLNTSLLELRSKIVDLNLTVAQLQLSNADLNSRVSDLEGSYSTLLSRISALEANYSVTNLKLAPYAIPFNFTYSNVHSYTTEQSGFVPMPYTSVMLTLDRASRLLIMFTADAWMSASDYNPGGYIICQAVVNDVPAMPNAVQLTPTERAESLPSHAHLLNNSTCSFNFYTDSLSAGVYTIKMQWYISRQGQGDIGSRTLAVIALPT